MNSGPDGLISWFMVVLSLVALLACGGCGGNNNPVNQIPSPIEIPGVGPNGIFDPSPAEDGSGKAWMSYSEVVPNSVEPTMNQIMTRVASSDDGGRTWTDSGTVINIASPGPTLPAPYTISVWQQEVSNLAFDPFDTMTGKPWKLIWHRYLGGYNSATKMTDRLFNLGWISLKSSSSPPGNLGSSVERNLFAGNLYDSSIDSVIGPPEYRLDLLYPAASELGECAVFTEPGMIATSNGIYVSLKCGKLPPTPGKTVLLLCSHDFSTCDYVGDMLGDTEAALFGASYTGFSASELAQVGSQAFLFVTPTEGDSYRGCMAFRLTDLSAPLATLKVTDLVERDLSGDPVPELSLFGTAGSFNGACGYTAEIRASGIIYSEFFFDTPNFRIFASGINLN